MLAESSDIAAYIESGADWDGNASLIGGPTEVMPNINNVVVDDNDLEAALIDDNNNFAGSSSSSSSHKSISNILNNNATSTEGKDTNLCNLTSMATYFIGK